MKSSDMIAPFQLEALEQRVMLSAEGAEMIVGGGAVLVETYAAEADPVDDFEGDDLAAAYADAGDELFGEGLEDSETSGTTMEPAMADQLTLNETEQVYLGTLFPDEPQVPVLLAPALELQGQDVTQVTVSVEYGINQTDVNDRLTIDALLSGTDAGSGISWAYNAGTGTLTLSGAATASEYESLLRTLEYVHADPASANTTARTVSVAVTYEDTTSLNDDLTLYIAHLDAGIEEVFENLDGLFEQFYNFLLENESLVSADIRESTDIIPYINSNFRDLMFPQRFVAVDEDGNEVAEEDAVDFEQRNNYDITLQPWDVAQFFDFGNLFNFGPGPGGNVSYDSLSEIAGALETHFTAIAQNVLNADTWEVSVDISPSQDAKGFTMTVNIAATKDVGTFELELGLLEDDLAIRLIEDLSFGAGGGVELSYALHVDLTGHRFDGLSIADARTSLEFEAIRGTAGFQFTDENLAIEVGMLRGTTVDMSGRLFGSLSLQFQGDVLARSIGAWQVSHLQTFLADGGEIQLDIPIYAELFGQQVTEPTTMISVFVADIFANTPPEYTAVDYERLQAFALLEPEDVIQSILDAEDLFGLLQEGGEALFGIPLPFVEDINLGEVFTWALLFSQEIGEKIDINEVLLITPGSDAMADIRTDPNFDPAWLFPALFPGVSTDALLRQEMKFAFILNEDMTTYTEIVVPESSSRNTLDDLVATLNSLLNALGGLFGSATGGLRALNISESLSFFAPANSGVHALHLVPHPDAPGDLKKFALMNEELIFLEREEGAGWRSTFKLDPSNPLVTDAAISISLNGQTEAITLARINGESAGDMLTRLATAIQAAFGANKINLYALQENLQGDLVSVTHPTGPFYIRLQAVVPEDTLELNITNLTQASGVVALGFFVGDNAATPRPGNLRTFQDFVDVTILERVPDLFSYDPVTNTVSLGYFEPLRDGITISGDLDLNYSFASVSQISPNTTVSISIHSELGFGFVIDFVLTPSEPITFNSGNFTSSDSFTLSDDAAFTVNFVLGNEYDVVVSQSDTVGNTALQDLVGDINTALRNATNTGTGLTHDLTENTFVARVNLSAIQLTNAIRLRDFSNPFTLLHADGKLNADEVLSFDLDGNTYLVPLQASDTSDFTHFAHLIAYINSQLANAFIDMDGSGTISAGDEVVSLADSVFASTYADDDEAFHIFTTGPPQAHWTFSANLVADAGGVFENELKFTGPTLAGNVRLTATVEGVQTRIRGFDGQDLHAEADLVQGNLTYTLPTTVDGSFRLGFNELDFGALDASGAFTATVAARPSALFTAEALLSDPVNTLDVFITNSPENFWVALVDLSSSEAAIDPSASIRFTVEDFQAIRVERFQDFSLPTPLFNLHFVDGEPTGILTEDTTITFYYEGEKYMVTVTAAETTGNLNFDELVAQFNAALAEAVVNDIGATTFDIRDTFRFRAERSLLQTQVLRLVPNPDYVTVEILPDLAAYGAIGAQTGFSTQAVVDALMLALVSFEEIFQDPEGFFSEALPIINTPMNRLWHLPGDFATRIMNLQNNPANSADVLPNRIAQAFGLNANEVVVAWDAGNQAYRIDFAFLTGTVVERPIDINPKFFAQFVEGSGDGLDRLIDGANRSPATFRGIVTFHISIGIDLSDPATPRYFLYEHDGSEDTEPENGTSVSVDFNIFADGIDFTSSKKALGLFIRDGIAILAGDVTEVNGETAFLQRENRNRTPYLLHLLENDFANITLFFGNRQDAGSDGKLYLGESATGSERNFELGVLISTISGSVQVVLPIYTPTETLNPFTNRQVSGITLVDPAAGTAQPNATGIVGGNVFELRIYDFGQYLEDAIAWSGLTGAQKGAVQASGNVELYVPDPESDAGIETPTLLDLLRDPALILDGIDFFFGVIQAGLSAIGSLPIPIIGEAFQGAANSVFSFRDGWLRDMRNRLRGAGEAFGQLAKESIFQNLGPDGVGILLQRNGISGLDGQVMAESPDDVLFDWIDANGNSLTDMGGYGAHGLEFQIRLGQILFDTGFTADLNFDALAPVLSLGLDGGFGFAVGWDLQIGFGFNLDDGFYIIVDGDRNELEVRVEGTLRGAQEHFEVRAVNDPELPAFPSSQLGTGYAIYNRRDNEWVLGPAKGDGSREPLYVINVDQDGNIVDSSEWEANLIFGSELLGGSSCNCSDNLIEVEAPELYWVVAAFDGDTSAWVPAYLDNLGQFRAQEGSFDPGQMILYDRAQPFSAFGSLFFLNLEASDQIRIGLDPPGDADYYFGIDEDQRSPNDRNDEDEGVRRNNHLPSRARASIGINLWDPSEQASDNSLVATSDTVSGWAGQDWTGALITDLGLSFTSEDANGFAIVDFLNLFDTDNGDPWFLVHLLDEDNADEIRDHFNGLLEDNGWTLEVERRPSFGSTGITVERVSIVDGVWSYLDADDAWQPIFDEDWSFIIRVPDEFGGGTYDVIRVKYIQLGDAYYDILENGTGWYIVDPDYSGVADGAVFDSVNGLLEPIFLFDDIEDDWLVPLFMLLSTHASLNDLVADGHLNAETFPGAGGTMPLGMDSDFTNLVRWGYWLPVLPFDFDPSENRITWEELRGEDSGKIIQLLLRADIIVNLSLELTVSDNAAFPKIRADLNLDWGIEVNFFDDDPFGEVNWYPHVGMNNIRLDMGSFLTQYLRPVLIQIDEGLTPIRPVIEVLTDPIPVISDIAGRDISLSNLLYQFGGPKGQAIATFIDIVRLVSDLSALVAELPDDMNVYLPIGNFWIPSSKDGLENDIYYDNNELTPPSFSQQNQALEGEDVAAGAAAFAALNDADKNNQSNDGITDNSKKGGFAFPVFSDPTQLFSLLMGGDAVLVTYSLPQLDFSFSKRIPLIQLGPFQAGIRFGFEITAQLHFGFDTYGIRKVMDTGNPLWAIDGLYISDRQNADGTGRDVPEVSMSATIALYGGIDVFLARGGIEGGFIVSIEIDLNDPNDDGKVRPSELLAVVEWTGNPLDWFNIRIHGEVYARYYYKVMIPIPYPFGIKRVTLFEGGKTFARLTLFDIQWEGSKGPPILGEKINFVTPDGELVENALLINMGPNSESRITNDDPWYSRVDSAIIDGNEKFVITNSGTSVTVTLYNRAGTSVVHSMTFSNVSMVVAYAGEGNDIIDASGLNGMRVYFEGMDGNNQITVGSTHNTQASWVLGGTGNDTLNVIGGGYTYFSGVSGTNAISLGQGATSVNVVQAGRDRDEISSGGNGATNTVNFSSGFGNINLSGMNHNSLATTLDFSRTFFPLNGEMSAANSYIDGGGNRRAMFHLAAITEIKGSQNRDTFTFRRPHTHQNGLMLRGGLGNDVFTFVLGDYSEFAAAGITIDNDITPTSEAILGQIVMDDCDGIAEIALASYTIGDQTFFHSGSGYIAAPEVRIVDPTGTGARAIAGLNTDGTISGIVITNRGTGYTNPTVELVNRTSFNDTVHFILEDTPDFTQDFTLNRLNNQHVLTYEGKVIRMTDSVENIIIEAPGAVVSAGQGGIQLEGRFQLRAERFIQTGSITADTILIVTDQGFAVDHPISAINHGNVSLEVLGRGALALATPVISGSHVVGYTLDHAGSHYNFTPQVVVRGGSAGTGAGAFAEGIVNADGEVTGFTVLKEGYGYSSIPVPDAYVTSPSSIYLNASVSSSALGSPAGYGDGRGTITLRTLQGSVLTSADVAFPADSQITWENGDFRFLANQTLNDIESGGSGAEAEAVLDDDGRVIGFHILAGGSGYTFDYAPTVRIQGAAEATAIVENGQVVGFNLTNPGGGYATAPLVSIVANGLSKIDDGGQTKHIKAANGFLVIDTDSGIGTIHRPVQSDVRVFVGRGALEGDSNLYILENNGFDIGLVDGINGVTSNASDIHLVSFSGDINLGMPVQRTNSAGDLLWQDAEKTIPVYETYQTRTVIGGREFLPGDRVFVGGNLNAQSGNIVLVADNFHVNSVVSSTGATLLSLRPADPTATLGLAGSRALAEAILDENGTVIGLNLLWQGRGYTDEPLVIFNAPGDRAFAVATALNGSVSSIELTYGGSFYDTAPVVTLSAPNLTGGTQATAQAIVRNGEVIGIEILNAGSGYTSSPRVNIALPGAQATARAQVQNGRVVGFFELQGGSNYSFVPRVTIDQPFTFGLDQFEIDFFQAGFDNFEVGRADGRNKVVTATQQFQETTILRGDSHFFEDTFVDGDLIVYGSGNTSYFNTGTTEATSITFNDALIINAGQTHTFRATGGGIFFQLPGTLNGTLPNSSTNPANQENVILDATGNIQIVGAIGNNAKIHNLTILKGANITFNDTITLSGNLVIENGAQITFERDVRIDGNLIIGNPADLSQIGSVTFTPGARLDVQGNIEIYSQGAVNFRNDVGQTFVPQSVVVISNNTLNFEGRLTANVVDLTAGSSHDIYFNQQVLVNDMHARAGNLLRVDNTISVGTGNLTLTANRIELLGGGGSIRNQTGTTGVTTLTIEPFTASRNIAVGAPVFFFGEEQDRLDITYREIAAINTGFLEVIFGDVVHGTGDVFVSDLGSTRNNFTSSPPPIQNPTTIVGGRVQVGYADDPSFFDPDISDVFEFIQPSEITVTSAAAYLRFKSLVTDVRIDAAINTFIQRNPWIRIEAERDIIINKPVQALTRISLTSGYSGAIAGSVTVNSTGGHTGHLITTSSTTLNHRIEISAGRVGGATGGNIVFTDVPFTGAGGDVTVWARNEGGRVLMQAPGGSITQNHGLIRAEILSLTASGNISLDLTDVDRVGAGTIDGVTLWKDGFVKDNGDDVFIDGIIITGSGNLTMTETDDLILDNVQTNGGNISLDNLVDSGGDFHLGTLGTVSGTIAMTVDGAITDNLAGQNIVNLTTTGLADLTAKTGIGGPGVLDIDTWIGSLTAQTTVSGGIHIDERNGLVIAGPLSTAGDGPILISLREGDLLVEYAVTADGSGNILLEVLNGTATLDAAVSSSTGHITVFAENDVMLNVNASISTATPGSVAILAVTGEVMMNGAATVTATDASIRIVAEGDIYLGNVDAGALGRVSVVSESFSIFNATGATVNVAAQDLRLEAHRAIGTPAVPLILSVDNLAAFANSDHATFKGIYLAQDRDVRITEMNPVTVQIVDTSNNLTPAADSVSLNGLVTANDGDTVLVAEGTVTLDAGSDVIADSSGSVRLEAFGPEQDVILNGNVNSGTGDITLLANRNIVLGTGVAVGTADPGTVYLRALNGGVHMDAAAEITATTSSLYIHAQLNVVLGQIAATHIAVTSDAGSVYTADAGIAVNITAENLRLEADHAIGEYNAVTGTVIPVTIAVTTLTAHARSVDVEEKGLYLRNMNTDVTVGAVAVTVREYNADATTTERTAASQADLVTLNDGEIVLETVNGTIVLTDANGNEFAVSAGGSGDITLTATGAGKDILIQSNADILGGTGNITLTARRDIRLNAGNVDILTGGAGQISLTAVDGTVFMADGSTIVNDEGDIELTAGTDIDVSLVQSGTGDLYLEAQTGAIRDNTLLEAANLVTAGTAHLKAAAGIGTNSFVEGDLNTRVNGLTALNTASGDIIIREETGFTIVDEDTLTQGGVVNQAPGGEIRILNDAGRITVNGAVQTSAGNTGADEGHIVLVGTNSGTEIVVNAPVTAYNGHLTLRANNLIEIYAPVEATGLGTIFVYAPDALGQILMEHDGVNTFGALITENQNIVVEAGLNVEVAAVDAGAATVEIAVFNGAIDSGSSMDITAVSLRLRAFSGIGALGDPLRTQVTFLSAYTVSGPIQISNLGNLIIDTVGTIGITEVLYATGFLTRLAGTPGSDESLSDVRTQSDGDILIVSETGSVTVNDGINEDGIGIESNGGNIVVEAATDLFQNADILTTGIGTIQVTALNGDIVMADGTTTRNDTGTVDYNAAGDVFLSLIESTLGGNVTVDAGDRIVDNTLLEAPNIITPGLATLLAVNGIGDVGAADINLNVGSVTATNTTSGRIVLREVNTLEIASGGISTQGGNGDIIVTVVAGHLTGNGPVSAHGSGNILLETIGVDSDIDFNADVTSTTGHITLQARRNIFLNENVDISTAMPGTVSMDAETGNLTMHGTVTVTAAGSAVRIAADGDITLGNITAAHVSIISRNGNVINAAGTAMNVTATNLRIEAQGDVGDPVRHLTTDIDNLSTLSATGSLYITEANGITVTNVSVTVTDFHTDATTTQVMDADQSDLTTLANGDIVLVALLGNITLTDGLDTDGIAVSAHGTGNVLIRALAGSLNVNADILSGTGHITLKAANDLALTANVNVETATPGTVSMDAETGNLTMHGTVTVTAAGSAVRIAADGDITLGNITAAHVSIISRNGNVINAADTAMNVTATNLRIEAQGDVGVPVRHLTTDIDNLSALSATGSIFITEANGITVTNVSVTVTDFNADASTSQVLDDDQSDLTTLANGDIVLVALLGNITLTDGHDIDGIAVSAHGTGNVLIRAVAGSLDVNADIRSGAGHITLKAANDLTLTANVNVETATPGTVSMDAVTGAVTMHGSVTVVATGSSARIAAEGAITLANVTAANVSIVSRNGNVINAAGTTKNVTAENLRIHAHGNIGADTNPLTTNIDQFTALSLTGSIYLTEDNAVTVTAVQVVVTEFNSDASFTQVTDAVQSDLTTLANGNIVLISTLGDITLTDGADLDGDTVNAHGSGNIFIHAVSGSVIVTADIHSGSGNIILNAGVDIELHENVDVRTAAPGFISMNAVTGNLTMHGSVNVEAVDASVRLAAQMDITLANVTGNNVSIHSRSGAIVSAVFATRNVTGINLRLEAEGNIGPLTTNVEVLAALSHTGSVYITDDTSTTLGLLGMTIGDDTDAPIHGVGAAGAVTLTTLSGRWLDGGDTDDDVRSDTQVTLTGADGLGTTGSGALEVAAPQVNASTVNGGSVYLNLTQSTELTGMMLAGTGNLYMSVSGDLDVSGTLTLTHGSGYVTVNGVANVSGTVTVSRDFRLVAESILLTAAGSILTQSGNTELRAKQTLTMATGAQVQAAQRNVVVITGGDAAVALLTAARLIDLRVQGNLTGVSLLRTEHELISSALRVLTGGTVSGLLTDTDRLDVRAGGDVVISEANDLAVGRYGLRMVNVDPAAVFQLNMNEAELHAVNESGRVTDEGTFRLQSDAVVTLATRLVSEGGDMEIIVLGLTLNGVHAGPMLDTPLGRVTLLSETGAGVDGVFPLTVRADEFTATAQSGQLAIQFVDTVRIVEDGVRLLTGSGVIALELVDGNLILEGRVVQSGNGNIRIEVPDGLLDARLTGITGDMVSGNATVDISLDTGIIVDGGDHLTVRALSHRMETRAGDLRLHLRGSNGDVNVQRLVLQEGTGTLNLRTTGGNLLMNATALIHNAAAGETRILSDASILMTNGAVIRNDLGRLDISFQNNFNVARIESWGNATYIESFAGDIFGNAGISGAHILTNNNHRPLFKLIRTKRIDGLLVDVDVVDIIDDIGNTTTRSRSTSSGFVDFSNPVLVL